MTTFGQLAALIPVAYLMGSIPFGLLVGLSKGVNPQKAGSGNIGATNVGRLLGAKYFWITFLLDFAKGLIPCLIASYFVHRSAAWGAEIYGMWLAVAFASIAGHMFSIFLKFKGGKGVATSTGVMIGIFPDFTLAAAAVVVAFSICFYFTRIVSLSAIVGAVVFPVSFVVISILRHQPVLGERWPLFAFAVVVGSMVILKHRGNIKRLLAGTEPVFGKH